jgi:hypothetical protein
MSDDETKNFPHAQFGHPDGSWYRLWVTHTAPKTARGHAWHLHATYDKSGTVAPVSGTRWWAQPYGMANWDFENEADATAAFGERADERLQHGYALTEGALPPEPSATATTEAAS